MLCPSILALKGHRMRLGVFVSKIWQIWFLAGARKKPKEGLAKSSARVKTPDATCPGLCGVRVLVLHQNLEHFLLFRRCLAPVQTQRGS